MSRSTRQRTYHWSDAHHWFLVAMAQQVLRVCGCPKSDGMFDVEELVNVGWLGCLRRCPKDRLAWAAKNVKREMIEYVVKARTGKSAWFRQRTTTTVLPIDEVERELMVEDGGFASVENEDWLEWVLVGLSGRHQTVVRRCVINKEEQAVVGKELHICGERVRQLKQEALAELRKALSCEV